MEGHEEAETEVMIGKRSMALKRKREDHESSVFTSTVVRKPELCRDKRVSQGLKCNAPIYVLEQSTAFPTTEEENPVLDFERCISADMETDEISQEGPKTASWHEGGDKHHPLEILASEFACKALESLDDEFGFGTSLHSSNVAGNSYFEGFICSLTAHHVPIFDPVHALNPIQDRPKHLTDARLSMETDQSFQPRNTDHFPSSEYQSACVGKSPSLHNGFSMPNQELVTNGDSKLKRYVSPSSCPPSLQRRSKAALPSRIREHIRRVAEKVSEVERTTSLADADMFEVENYIQSQLGNLECGVKLIQRLLACAEAVACRDTCQAASLLTQVRLLASPYGTSLQRVAACFAEGLSARIKHLSSAHPDFASVRADCLDMEKLEGFHLMHDACPYVSFGHFAANSVILEAFEGKDAVHVLDLGMELGLQWPSLMQSLATRASGPPGLLTITGIGLSADRLNEVGKQLHVVATNLKLPFQFKMVVLPLENLQSSMLKLRDDEVLAVNSVLQLHRVVKESRGSLNIVLQSIHKLSPKVLTLVEQDANHNGPFFLGRFTEALHYYSAIFDSLDAIMPRYSTQRVKIEQFHFGHEIKNIVSCEGSSRLERHERVDQWRRRMSRAGFHVSTLNPLLAEARAWLARNYSCDGYTVAEEKSCLILGWKGKPVVAASAWRC